MKYNKTIVLKNGMECCLRNGTESDGQLVLDNFNLTHEETDYLLSYPDEISFDAIQESQFLKAKSESEKRVELSFVVIRAIFAPVFFAFCALLTSSIVSPCLEIKTRRSSFV